MNSWLNQNQQKIAIITGYILVFLLAFGLGKLTTSVPRAPEIKVEELAGQPQLNNSSNTQDPQSQPTATTTSNPQPVKGDCGGKIKGNIGSSGMIYHVPGGAFYDRTQAEQCFDTEAQAQAAGFRKSLR